MTSAANRAVLLLLLLPSIWALAGESGECAASGACELTGHYAELTDVPAEQAGRAFRGEVPITSEEGWAVATFAAGCFWGPQLLFDRVEGVTATSVGYTRGHTERPNYDEMGDGSTGHAEAIQVFYDPDVVSYERLLEVFWGRIDPTVKDGQGGDFGTEYRTAVYLHTEEQRRLAEASRAEQQKLHSEPIATEVEPAA